MSAAVAKTQKTWLLQQMYQQIKQLRIATAGQDDAYALVKALEECYLQADENLTRGMVHLHTANQSLHAMMSLLLNCQENQQINCEQMAALLEPIRQELHAGFIQISDVM
ncbi:putative neuraminidase [Chromobacterium alkanivorans]|jgi:predicted neuraminidase|uniref:hypothetical protein n=1 Tax=Chromobacterium TaxID=535 RepID=UPI0006543E15|nr:MULTISPECIES: hypothetical protein [Chromobacterium]KMN78976.1 hypothetical protein VK98_17060 [Chromobacterium sp. LK11]MBN3006060.1 hypothetical protein [Chromobacterium alkanivorans]MCS3805684.1 putative neuraminidase [Chromobacterium alkanivorans]MCS3820086.1 putative neuraminidase [Chromobacterium alkanivorans]MCS3874843.1 putative neuraminidase [Chromobacterium alkanivorans]